jgi:SnoaL-like domain
MSESSPTTLPTTPKTPKRWGDVPPPDDALEVQNLLQMYAFLVDQGRGQELGTLFVDDAEWDGTEIGVGSARGRDDIVALITGLIDPARPMIHLPGPPVLTGGGDEIHGVCWCMFTMWTGSGTAPILYFHYEDVFQRESGDWRFARRVLRRRFPGA